jgi:hypothetical protein
MGGDVFYPVPSDDNMSDQEIRLEAAQIVAQVWQGSNATFDDHGDPALIDEMKRVAQYIREGN